uniref:Uncharacterized protein n=1 Tax=Zea mays TaxID=4577 RepID=B7ZYE3_MAIZE|nr:unknown [Zea mays]
MARFTVRELTSGVIFTSYWVRSLSGSSARKWLALTTQRAPTVPNPGRRQNDSPLLGTGGPMTVRGGGACVCACAGASSAARGSPGALALPRRLPPPLHLLPPSGTGSTAAAAAGSALGCVTLLCSGCFLRSACPPLADDPWWSRACGGGGGGVMSRTTSSM